MDRPIDKKSFRSKATHMPAEKTNRFNSLMKYRCDRFVFGSDVALYCSNVTPADSVMTSLLLLLRFCVYTCAMYVRNKNKPDPTHHPKRHRDPISRVATAHMCGRTDGMDEWSVT